MIRINRGVDLPIAGEPSKTIEDGPQISRVALIGDDYIGIKPTMQVNVGDAVKLGQTLFTDKKTPGVQFASPACGKVVAINRGAKRAFQSIEIEREGDDEQTFQSHENADLPSLTRDQVRETLVASGLWTSLRARPFSKIPSPDSVPHSIFVSAIDTNPLAAPPELVISGQETPFLHGLQVLRHLTDGMLYVCTAPGAAIPGRELDFTTFEEFDGPHPAGLPGTHIHFLDPVCDKKTVWHLDYQDVIAIGRLFATGRVSVERVISLGGPGIRHPRLVRTCLGADMGKLTEQELERGDFRVISGSVYSGRAARAPSAYLGRYHRQISVIPEDRERKFLGWQDPGFSTYSVKRVFASAFFRRGEKLPFTTSMQGSPRAMVPIGMYEKVMPLDLLPTFLLRALIVGDVEQAQALGCLELDEEDVALCTFVCPGKYEYGPILRDSLTRIEAEG